MAEPAKKKYLVTRAGCGNYTKGDVVALTDAEAKFYAAKIQSVEPEKKPAAKK